MRKSRLLGLALTAFLACVAGEAKADSAVSALSYATTLTAGGFYFDQAFSSDRKLGIDTTIFGLSGNNLSILPAGLTSSLLANTGVTAGAYTPCLSATVNAQGQITSVASVACMLVGATAGGSLTGTFPNPTIAAKAISYANIQNETSQTVLCNPTGAQASPQECTLGANLSFVGNAISAAGAGATVTSVAAGNPGLMASPTSGAVVVSAQFPVQATRTTNTTLAAADAFTSIPMGCPSPCTVTINSSASNYFPQGYPVNIVATGSATVTVQIGTGSSTFYGATSTAGITSFTLNAPQNAYIQADNNGAPNNYLVTMGGGSAGTSGAFTKIGAYTAAAAATLDITALPATYSTIWINCPNLIPSANTGVTLSFLVGTGAGPTWHNSSVEWWFEYQTPNATAWANANSSSDTSEHLSVASAVGNLGKSWYDFKLNNYGTSTGTDLHNVKFEGTYLDTSGNPTTVFGEGDYFGGSSTAAITGIRIQPNANNISGTCTAYGLTQ
jgi:hypothetical protein